jgi:16S rRNA (guanine527-N7)-methyltransferase
VPLHELRVDLSKQPLKQPLSHQSSTRSAAASSAMTLTADELNRRNRLGAAADALGLPLDAPTLDQLMAYLQLLQRWNRVYNLTALRDPDEMLSHHLIDCLSVLGPLRRQLAGLPQGAPVRLLDVGSGGGLPGVVLAVVEPRWQISCVDTVAKKANFIRQVAAELRLPNLQGLHARVEALPPTAGQFDVITSRAFASLIDFTRLSRAALAEHGVWMAMKGKLPEDEMAALPSGVQVFHVEQLQVPGLDAQRCLVWLRPQATV